MISQGLAEAAEPAGRIGRRLSTVDGGAEEPGGPAVGGGQFLSGERPAGRSTRPGRAAIVAPVEAETSEPGHPATFLTYADTPID